MASGARARRKQVRMATPLATQSGSSVSAHVQLGWKSRCIVMEIGVTMKVRMMNITNEMKTLG